jgi:hypothetical protein
MTVKELITQLEQLEGSKEIVFHSYIEIGRGGSWIEVKDFDIDEHDDLDNTYRLSISGDEGEVGGYD